MDQSVVHLILVGGQKFYVGRFSGTERGRNVSSNSGFYKYISSMYHMAL